MKKEKLNIRIPTYDMIMIRNEAENKNKTVSDIIRDIISKHITKRLNHGDN